MVWLIAPEFYSDWSLQSAVYMFAFRDNKLWKINSHSICPMEQDYGDRTRVSFPFIIPQWTSKSKTRLCSDFLPNWHRNWIRWLMQQEMNARPNGVASSQSHIAGLKMDQVRVIQSLIRLDNYNGTILSRALCIVSDLLLQRGDMTTIATIEYYWTVCRSIHSYFNYYHGISHEECFYSFISIRWDLNGQLSWFSIPVIW